MNFKAKKPRFVKGDIVVNEGEVKRKGFPAITYTVSDFYTSCFVHGCPCYVITSMKGYFIIHSSQKVLEMDYIIYEDVPSESDLSRGVVL